MAHYDLIRAILGQAFHLDHFGDARLEIHIFCVARSAIRKEFDDCHLRYFYLLLIMWAH